MSVPLHTLAQRLLDAWAGTYDGDWYEDVRRVLEAVARTNLAGVSEHGQTFWDVGEPV